MVIQRWKITGLKTKVNQKGADSINELLGLTIKSAQE